MTVGGIVRPTCKEIPVEIEIGYKIVCQLIDMGLLEVKKEKFIYDEHYCWLLTDENPKCEVLKI